MIVLMTRNSINHLRSMVWCKCKECRAQCSVPYQMKRRTHFHQRPAGRAAERQGARASQGRFILTLCSQPAGWTGTAGLAVR